MREVLRALLNLVVALVVAVPAPAFARDSSSRAATEDEVNPDKWSFSPFEPKKFQEIAQKDIDAFHGEQIATLDEEIQRQVEEHMKRLPGLRKKASFRAQGAETMMQLWILAFAHSVYQQQKMQPLSDRKLTMGQAAALTADQLANGFDVYAGMMGGAAAAFGFEKPMESMRKALLASGTKESLAKLLSSGVGNFVTFFGWEGGEQLWQQSMYDLSADEMAVAKNLRFFDILVNNANSLDQWVKERKVLAKMFGNAFCIMTFIHPQATSEWIYNTWRLRLGTGRFVTTFTSMVAAGTLAGTLAPGEGNFIGLCFGLVGGLIGGAVAMMLPDEYVDPITDKIRAKRVNHGYDNLEQNKWLLKRYQDYAHKQGNVTDTQGFEGFLKYRSHYRNDIATALIEQIYDAYVKMQEADVILGLVKSKAPVNFVRGAALDAYVNPENMQSPPASSELIESVEAIGADYLKQKEEAKKRFQYYFEQLMSLQRTEAIALGVFALDDSPEFPAQARIAAKVAIADQKTVLKGLRQMYASLMPEMKEKFVELKDWKDEDLKATAVMSQILLNVFYLRGFTEASLHD